MSLSPETQDRLTEAIAQVMTGDCLVITGQLHAAMRKHARAALAVVLDDPQVTITERTAVPPHHHEYVGGRCYRCGLASPTQWIGALDGRPVNPENETSSDDR